MEKPKFVYVTYIRTTPEKLWNALTDPKFTRQYFFDSYQESAWKPAAPWKMVFSNGQLAVSGEVLVIDPPRKLVLSWKSESKHQEEAPARMTYTLEPQDDQVKLTLVHESDVPNSKVIESVSNGWPMVLASLKSLLETGKALDITSCCPGGRRMRGDAQGNGRGHTVKRSVARQAPAFAFNVSAGSLAIRFASAERERS